MRIILTGSRSWVSVERAGEALLPLHARYPDAVLVNGYAGGADKIGDRLWRDAGGRTERYPIGSWEWRQPCRDDCDHGPRPRRRDGTSYCPSPGPRRNQVMADRGAGLCVALRMPGKSNGTDDMIRRAAAAGIPVRLFGPDGEVSRETAPTPSWEPEPLW